MKLIKTSKDHDAALQRLEELMLADPAPGTADDEELELLAFLIEDYEKRTIRIPAATPAEAIRWDNEPIIRRITRWVNSVRWGRLDHKTINFPARLVPAGSIGPVRGRGSFARGLRSLFRPGRRDHL